MPHPHRMPRVKRTTLATLDVLLLAHANGGYLTPSRKATLLDLQALEKDGYFVHSKVAFGRNKFSLSHKGQAAVAAHIDAVGQAAISAVPTTGMEPATMPTTKKSQSKSVVIASHSTQDILELAHAHGALKAGRNVYGGEVHMLHSATLRSMVDHNYLVECRGADNRPSYTLNSTTRRDLDRQKLNRSIAANEPGRVDAVTDRLAYTESDLWARLDRLESKIKDLEKELKLRIKLANQSMCEPYDRG